MKLITKLPPAKIAFRQLAAALFCVAVLANLSLAQKSSGRASDSGPIIAGVAYVSSQDPNVYHCADLNSDNVQFPTITDDNELRLFFGTPTGTFQYRSYTAPEGQVNLFGPVPLPQYRSVRVASSGNTVTSFASQVIVNAVIARISGVSYIFYYPTGASSDSNLVANTTGNIEYVQFCYGLSLSPSAGPANISGRVVDANGRGISGSSLTITDPSSGAALSVRSNPFGYYTFPAVPSGQLYIISITDKRRTFSTNTRSITVNEDLVGIDFVADPQ